MPSWLMNAMAWNSLCAPLPMSAMVRLLARAKRLAAIADVAAVRSAVAMVNSLSRTG
ncbi:hypothetical protein D3C78_1601100 [compost metagenome]